MEHASTIAPQDWMISPQTQSVMKVLGGLEDVPKALFVGGCVRNALMEKPITDIDIATKHRPDKVMQLLLDAGIRAIPTGLEHGTVTALVDDRKFEITTLRRDVETDDRHAVIAFSEDWLEDAQRRDFTINTLLAAPDGRVYDPTGRGLADIKARKIIFVGEPAQRIAEDYLRIFRFFRFYGQYGAGEPDSASLDACRIHADKIKKLSKERITQEFFKILALPHAATILEFMKRADIMTDIRGRSYRSEKMEKLCKLQDHYEAPDTIVRLGLLSGFDKKRAEEWLVLSNEQKDRLIMLGEAYDKIPSPGVKKLRNMVYSYNNHIVTQTYLLWLAIKDLNPNLEWLDVARYWQAPSFPITGDDLIAKGVPPGKSLGKKLKALEEKWIKSDFKTLPKY